MAAGDFAIGNNVFHYALSQLIGHREVDTVDDIGAATFVTYLEIGVGDTDQITIAVYQCTTRITLVQYRIGLNEVDKVRQAGASGATYNTLCNGLAQVVGVTNGHHHITHAKVGFFQLWYHMQVVFIDL